MAKSLSILLPTYNNCCLPFVKSLQEQAEKINTAGFKYEIIIADDGSSDISSIDANSKINELPNCRFITRKENVGRAAIRNFLANEANYENVLFLDSDMKLFSDDFLLNYISHYDEDVVCGGLKIGGDPAKLKHNLRYKIEKKHEKNTSLIDRQNNEYQSFSTANFMTKRNIIIRIPFDKRFYRYGYEDVMWGKQLSNEGIHISHINNPVMFSTFDGNKQYVSKIETSISVLGFFKDELADFSQVISVAEKMKRNKLDKPFNLIFKLFRKAMRANLTSNHPIASLLNVYKLGLFINNNYRN